MLPSSHLVPIIARLPGVAFDGALDRSIDEQLNDPMESAAYDGLRLRRDGEQQIELKSESEMQTRTNAELLADAFSEFISASSRLEGSYRDLQEQLNELGLELAERNAALNTSLADNERMRLALQQIVDSMPCGVLVVDRDGEISMINPESGRMLGLDLMEFSGGFPTSLQQISARSGVNLELAYETDSSRDVEQEFCLSDAAGKRWIGIRNRRLFNESAVVGKPDQTIFILRDITAQKRAEKEREAARNAMALAGITTILAHEIRNPLASLELFAELIEQDGDRSKEWISHLRAGIRTLSGTVNNVLTFHGAGSLKLVPLDLSALIGSAIQFIQPLADQADVSLEWLSEGDPMLVMGNESALQQVVMNLVSNAIRHTPTGGSVTVSLRTKTVTTRSGAYVKQGQHAYLEFCDTGSGIRLDQIESIFQPGFSGDGDSSGLGLAVCERIMKQHGGSISASNAVNRGACFSLEFPMIQLESAIA